MKTIVKCKYCGFITAPEDEWGLWEREVDLDDSQDISIYECPYCQISAKRITRGRSYDVMIEAQKSDLNKSPDIYRLSNFMDKFRNTPEEQRDWNKYKELTSNIILYDNSPEIRTRITEDIVVSKSNTNFDWSGWQ